MTKDVPEHLKEDGTGRHRNQRPKPAATLIVLRRRDTGLEVLMGRRSHGHVFMPGMVVFPGGRIDRADYRMVVSTPLHPEIQNRIRNGLTGKNCDEKALALGLCAVRETYEETGLLLGQIKDFKSNIRHTSWRAFAHHGVLPDLRQMRLIARAITPPRRSRRFDTWFFVTFAEQIAVEAPVPDIELEEPEWFTLEAAREQDLPRITRQVLDDLDDRLDTDPKLAPDNPIPFYFMRHGQFHREMI